MSNKKINLEAIGHGVILQPVFEEVKMQTESGIVVEATQEKVKKIWKGVCKIVKVGPDVTLLKEGDEAYMNIETRAKVAFEHKGEQYLWTLDGNIFAKILPESGIIL